MKQSLSPKDKKFISYCMMFLLCAIILTSMKSIFGVVLMGIQLVYWGVRVGFEARE